MDLKGKVALISGASGGLGKVICRRLAEKGARLAVAYHGDRETAEELVRELRTGGAEAQAFTADLSETESATGQTVVVDAGRVFH